MRRLRRRAALAAAVLTVLRGPAAARAAPPPAAADPATARATKAPQGGPAAPGEATPAAVPLPLIVSASEQALSSVARIERAMRNDAELDRIARALPDEERNVSRLRAAVAAGRLSFDADRELLGIERELVRTERRPAAVGRYLASPEANPFADLALFLAVAAAFWALRRALAADPRSVDTAPARLVRRPIVSALAVALVLVPVLERRAPPRLADAALLLATVPFTAVAAAALPRTLLVPVAVLAFLIALDRLVLLGPGHTAGARLLLLAVCLAGAGVARRGVRRGGWAAALGEGRSGAVARAGVWCVWRSSPSRRSPTCSGTSRSRCDWSREHCSARRAPPSWRGSGASPRARSTSCSA